MDSKYQISSIKYTGGEEDIPTGAVRITMPNGSQVETAAVGNGPVDALFNAIKDAVSTDMNFVGFAIENTRMGSDAPGEVVVQLKSPDGSKIYEGRSQGTDIIVASARAAVDALNTRFFQDVVAVHTV
jgi:2-isopropylmalate synthase